MKPSHKMLDKNYPSLGYCIFCLDKALPPRKLTEEHIVTNAIGGTLRFKGATCKQCAEKMNEKFEQPALNADFLVARLLLGLRAQGKQSIADLPKVALGPVDVSVPGDEGFDKVLSRSEYPKLLQFLHFGPPGHVIDKVHGSGIDAIQFSMGNISDLVPSHYVQGRLAFRHKTMPYEFGMAIVKAAYAYAVAECGIDSFETKSVRDLLSYEREDLRNFFGCPQEGSLYKGPHLHHLSWQVKNGYIVVLVHLLASYRVGAYEVAVGKLLN